MRFIKSLTGKSMILDNKNRALIYRIISSAVVLIFFWGVGSDIHERYQYMLGAPFSMWKPSFFLVVGFCLMVLISAMTGIWNNHLFDRLIPLRQRLGRLRWVGVVAAGGFTSWFFVFARWSEIFSGDYARLLVYLATALFMIFWATKSEDRFFDWQGVFSALVLFAGIFTITHIYQHTTNYPFPLYWSEGNRYWDYSVLYGRRLYIYPPDKEIPAYIDIGRQSLWGLPFLFGNISILQMRLWNATMFSIPYLLLGWIIFWPEKGKLGQWLLLGLWSLIFLNQGPIYTPLVLAAILVAGARRMPVIIGMLLVALAGYYGRGSRSTWMFAPAIWAGVIALVQSKTPPVINTNRRRWLWAAGMAAAGLLGGVFIPEILPQIIAAIKGLSIEASIISPQGISSYGGRQPLLWNRLWPNPTNPKGILLMLVEAILPLSMIIIVFAVNQRWRLNIWQKFAIIGSQLAFLVVGITISVKIGGGSNLHNVDMFLIGLLFVAGLAWDAGGKEWLSNPGTKKWWIKAILLLVIILPVFHTMMVVETMGYPEKHVVQGALNDVQSAVAEAKEDGDVLFIDHRQLLTFGHIKDVPLIAEYEKKRMMDEAMANNASYFEAFNRDLAAHRFSLIISELLSIKFQGDDYLYGNENDAWVRWVSIPVLCYYKEIITIPEVGLQLLIPRKTMLDDPNVDCPVP